MTRAASRGLQRSMDGASSSSLGWRRSEHEVGSTLTAKIRRQSSACCPEWPTLPPLLEALASTSRCCWTLGLRKRASEIIIALVPQEERRKRSRFFLSNFSVLYLRRLKK